MEQKTSNSAPHVPIVSVVMVTHNVEEYLEEAVASILGQEFTGLELVIADFGSTDRSREIVEKFATLDARVRLEQVVAAEVVEARNAACVFARGKYIAVMDADDVSLPNRLKEQVRILEENERIGLVGGAATWIDGQGNVMWDLRFPQTDEEIRSELPRRFPFCHAAVTLRRDIFEKIGGYRKIFTTAHDYDLGLRFSEHCACANIAEPVVKYRVHGSQLSLSRRRQQTLCKLAAQASAKARREGTKDPLDSCPRITPDVLRQMGVSEAEEQANLLSDYCNWIESVRRAGEDATALKAAEEAVQLKWSPQDRDQIAGLYWMSAQLYSRKREHLRAAGAVLRAVALKPSFSKEVSSRILSRLHLVRS